jgi:hypothetical protein
MDHWFLDVGLNHGLTLKNGGIAAIKCQWEAQNGVCALPGNVIEFRKSGAR